MQRRRRLPRKPGAGKAEAMRNVFLKECDRIGKESGNAFLKAIGVDSLEHRLWSVSKVRWRRFKKTPDKSKEK